MKLSVSIVDDDEAISHVLVELVQKSENLVLLSAYNDSLTALSQLPEEQPDVVLMDINMPEPSGIECVRQLKPSLPHTEFLMLTAYSDADHIFAALAAGATGYLLKGTDRTELLAAIQQITEGGSPMSCGIARKVVQSFARTIDDHPDLQALSPRERKVLELLAQGYLYKEIAQTLDVKRSTVETFVRRIYIKLQVNSRSKAIAKYLSK